MGILSNILAKIFPSHTGAANAGTTTTAQAPSTPPGAGTAPPTGTAGTTAAAAPAAKPR
jgi:hypothetical protein